MRLLLCLALVMFAGCSTDPSSAPEPDLIAFSATWCQPCQRDKPLLAEVAQEFSVTEMDIDSQREIVAQYGVTSVPTYVIRVDGVERQRTSDLRTALRVLRFLRQVRHFRP